MEQQLSQTYSKQQPFIYKYRDYIAGGIGGIASIIIGQPFDTIKVRLQASQNPNFTMSKAIRSLIDNEGYMAFYKGAALPLVGAFLVEFVRFGTFSNTKIFLKNSYFEQNPGKTTYSEKAQYLDVLKAGFLAGTVTSFVASPIEHIRIRVQLITNVNFKYNNCTSCLQYVYKNYGIRGIYKGLGSTIARDSTGYLVYFGIYDSIFKQMNKKIINDSQDLKLQLQLQKVSQVMAGGLSGIFLWCAVYPIDTAKSILQSDSIKNPRYNNTINILANSKFADLYKGIKPCMMRAFPANAGIFVCYEQVKGYIEQNCQTHY